MVAVANNSASGGFLLPADSPAPLEGQAFEDFLQQIFVGLTGIQGKFVRPSWQPEPPDLPEANKPWFAFAISEWDADTYAFEDHDAAGFGSSSMQRHETVRVLLSFFGERASYYMALLRDGLQISQNREVFQRNAMGLVETGVSRSVPSLVKENWLYRIDMPLIMRRLILRTYPVLNIASLNCTLNNDRYVTPINVSQGRNAP